MNDLHNDVLLIEDNPGDVHLVVEMLDKAGPDHFALTLAASLAEARALAERHFDVLLLDLGLPDSSGTDTLVAALALFPRVPIIILTGEHISTLQHQGRPPLQSSLGRHLISLGAQDYLEKAILTGNLLVRTILHAIERHAIQHEMRQTLQLLDATLNATADGILAVGFDGTLLSYNQRFVEMWRLSPEMLGPDRREAILDIVSTQLAEPEQFRQRLAYLDAHPDEPSLDVLRLRDGRVIERRSQPQQFASTLFRHVWSFRDVTARIRAEAALRANEARYRLLTENISDVIWTGDLEGNFTYVSPSVKQLRGYTPDEVLQQTFEESLTPASWEIVVDGLHQIRKTHDRGETFDYRARVELEQTRKDGSTVWTEAIIGAMYDAAGEFLGVQGVTRDITSRRKAERALEESEHKFRSFIKHSDDGIVLVDEQGRVIEWNPGMERITGMPRQDALGQLIWEAQLRFSAEPVTPAQRAQLRQMTLDAIHTGDPSWASQPRDYTLRRLDGAERIVQTITFPIPGPNGYLLGSTTRDVTEQHRIRAAERDQRELADALRDIASALSSSLDSQTILDRILQNLGRVVPHDTANIMLLEDGCVQMVGHRGYDGRAMQHCLRSQPCRLAETPHLHRMVEQRRPVVIASVDEDRDSNPFCDLDWVKSYAGVPIVLDDEVLGFLNVTQNIAGYYTATHAERLQVIAYHAAIAIQNARLYDAVHSYARELEQRVVERTAALHRSTERIEMILNQTSDAILVLRADGFIDQANLAFNQLFGYDDDPDAIVGKLLSSVLGHTQASLIDRALCTACEQNAPQRVRTTVRHRRGHPFEVDIALSAPIIRDDGTPGNVVCSIRDITRLKESEDNLRAALAKEKELGELKSRFVSMVSHEFRTPLATIQSSSDLLLEYSARMTEDKKTGHLTKIQTQVQRLARMLDDILTMSRIETVGLEYRPSTLDLRAVCSDILADARQFAPAGVTITFDYEGCPEALELDDKLLRHILNNLLSNAVKYSPDGGEVSLAVRCTAHQTTITIRDQGIGIPHADQKHLFKPFHRATNVGNIKGTGLGLAITQRAVKMHGGVIELDSVVGRGTTFTVRLPTGSQGSQS